MTDVIPIQVKCPTCGAEPGEPCSTRPVSITRRLEGRPGRSHPARFDKAERLSIMRLPRGTGGR